MEKIYWVRKRAFDSIFHLLTTRRHDAAGQEVAVTQCGQILPAPFVTIEGTGPQVDSHWGQWYLDPSHYPCHICERVARLFYASVDSPADPLQSAS